MYGFLAALLCKVAVESVDRTMNVYGIELDF